MFENIGEKIKILAKIICGIGIAISLTWGIEIVISMTDSTLVSSTIKLYLILLKKSTS